MANKIPPFIMTLMVFVAGSILSPALGHDLKPAAEAQIDPAIIQWMIESNIPAAGQNFDMEKSAISAQSANFSAAYLERDVTRIMDFFGEGASIVPVNGSIISGRDKIKNFWTNVVTSSVSMLSLNMEPEELVVEGNIATDLGYYNGVSTTGSGQKSPFGGAYVTVWKKTAGVWRMQHSMWRAIQNRGGK